MRAVLDTGVVLGSGVPELEGDLAVSAITLAELHYGVLTASDADVRAERLRRVSLLESLFSPLPVDDAVARSYGRLAAAVTVDGQRPPASVADLLIAATAHAHEARLYTRNAENLRGLDELVDIVEV